MPFIDPVRTRRDFSQSRRVRNLPSLGETLGEGHMRLIFGMIIGAALTAGSAYVADAMAGIEAKPIVNWSVVAENIDTRDRPRARRSEEDCRLMDRAS
jgi:hypothetical protein